MITRRNPAQPPPSAPARRPTMTDVAKAAGVSQSTVSMVLNNMSGARLAAATRERVQQAARSIGYQLPGHGAARNGSEVRRNLVAYLVDEISTSPHPVVSVDGARDEAWAHDCLVAVTVTRSNAEQEAAAIEAMKANPSLLGFIYSTIFTRAVSVPVSLLDVPVVLLNCHDERSRLPAVVPGEVGGGHAATERLIAAGHTRIAFINGEPWMEAAQDRLKGYRRALATADLPFDAALVRDGDWMSSSGYACTVSLMGEKRPPTAIFCANDLMALGALEALAERGLKVPQDVALMGYDDQEISRHTRPPLTTMVLPNYEMGRVAMQMLLQAALAGGPGGNGSVAAARTRRTLIKVDCPLVERETVRDRSSSAAG